MRDRSFRNCRWTEICDLFHGELHAWRSGFSGPRPYFSVNPTSKHSINSIRSSKDNEHEHSRLLSHLFLWQVLRRGLSCASAVSPLATLAMWLAVLPGVLSQVSDDVIGVNLTWGCQDDTCRNVQFGARYTCSRGDVFCISERVHVILRRSSYRTYSVKMCSINNTWCKFQLELYQSEIISAFFLLRLCRNCFCTSGFAAQKHIFAIVQFYL